MLDLLARTGRTGELQVVGADIERRIWVDQGDLVDTDGTGSTVAGLFALGCVEEGWFYFTLTDTVPDGMSRVPLPSVIADLTPQVAEWYLLVALLPFDAVVRMSTSTPAEEVQIRADQWQLLSLVGGGREVREVVAASALHPLDTLRTLRELTDGFLVTVEPVRRTAGDRPADVAADDAGPPGRFETPKAEPVPEPAPEGTPEPTAEPPDDVAVESIDEPAAERPDAPTDDTTGAPAPEPTWEQAHRSTGSNRCHRSARRRWRHPAPAPPRRPSASTARSCRRRSPATPGRPCSRRPSAVRASTRAERATSGARRSRGARPGPAVPQLRELRR